MKVLLRDIRAGKRRAAIVDLNSIVRAEIEKVLDEEVKPALVKAHEAVVANWRHKPRFQARKFLKEDSIFINIFPTGEHKDIWIWVDQGTKPHPITARRAPLLKFRYPYLPKTKPRAQIVAGGGQYGPNWASKVSVQHPGTKARNFTVSIAEDAKPDFKRVVENAFRRAARKMEE